MCLLILKPAGVPVNEPFLESCLEVLCRSYKSGWGYAVKQYDHDKKEATLIMNKGFFDRSPKVFIDSLIGWNLSDNDEILIHGRAATNGETSESNAHPYVHDEVRGANGLLTIFSHDLKKPVTAHNGIFGRDTYTMVDRTLSDTYNFIQSVIDQDMEGYKEDPVAFFKHYANGEWAKVGTLFPEYDQLMVHSDISGFIKDKGYLFSNGGYKNPNYVDVGGVATITKPEIVESNDDLKLPSTSILNKILGYSIGSHRERIQIKNTSSSRINSVILDDWFELNEDNYDTVHIVFKGTEKDTLVPKRTMLQITDINMIYPNSANTQDFTITLSEVYSNNWTGYTMYSNQFKKLEKTIYAKKAQADYYESLNKLYSRNLSKNAIKKINKHLGNPRMKQKEASLNISGIGQIDYEDLVKYQKANAKQLTV
jgi:hypothetical protein